MAEQHKEQQNCCCRAKRKKEREIGVATALTEEASKVAEQEALRAAKIAEQQAYATAKKEAEFYCQKLKPLRQKQKQRRKFVWQ